MASGMKFGVAVRHLCGEVDSLGAIQKSLGLYVKGYLRNTQ